MNSYIKAIEYYLPEGKDYNDEADRMTKKIGISVKNIAAKSEYASDLAVKAAQKIFSSGSCRPEEIDFLIYCTQSPDYYLPTTACIVQERLKLSTSCGALDINLGCSGYVYGLSLAKGLIEANMAKNVLLITSDTYSKYIHPEDRSVRLLFGDGAAATLLAGSVGCAAPLIGPFVFGTDGTGANNLIVPAGGLKEPKSEETSHIAVDEQGNKRSRENLYMNGSEILNFALIQVPKAIEKLCERSGMEINHYDYFVFHQANQYMLEMLRRKLSIPKEKFSIQFSDCGNTVSSTIPIALKRDFEEGKIKAGDVIQLVGFGVGYSWGACNIKILNNL